ncbi:aspartyl protease family protein [Massilia sp. TWR1-2-2]|uniref:aspartyl protease family protein n=1 Tax=Massilia sp. TWR1-2-2 TaxID=2804584 RepID=UPI003CFAA693
MLNPLLRRALPLAFLLGASAAVHADATPAKCQYVNVATVPLRYLGASFHPAVDGTINGAPAPMVIDTGSGRTYLTPRAAKRLGLVLGTTGQHVDGVGGASRVYRARVGDFAVGPTRTEGRYMNVIGDMAPQHDFDAIVGADFLFQADVELSLAEKALRFFRGANCKDSHLGYWSESTYAVPMTGYFGESCNPTFEVELNGVKLDAIIDSGSATSFVFDRAARKAGVGTDAPGSQKSRDMVGVGSERLANWRAVFATLKIGAEMIRDAELNISAKPASGRLPADILLGTDFLRTHRVLFATSQKKRYISYLGADVFFRGARGFPPWMLQEAEAGNAEAQYAVSGRLARGIGVPVDQAQAAEWLSKAASQGHPAANIEIGVRMLRKRQFAQAAELLGTAAAQRPEDARAPLFLYLARLQAGDPARAARELAQRFAADQERRWPAPIADFYLGRIDAERLLGQADKDPALAFSRSCEARLFIAEQAGAAGERDKSKALLDELRGKCARPPPSTPGRPGVVGARNSGV